MTLKRLENGEIYFTNPKWNTSDTIDCTVKLAATDEDIPFNATPYDEEDYGRELYEMLSTKYASQVESCTDSERDAVAEGDALRKRNRLLRDSDWVASTDVNMSNQADWLAYRQALRDITDQDGYPHTINWPLKPDTTRSLPS